MFYGIIVSHFKRLIIYKVQHEKKTPNIKRDVRRKSVFVLKDDLSVVCSTSANWKSIFARNVVKRIIII